MLVQKCTEQAVTRWQSTVTFGTLMQIVSSKNSWIGAPEKYAKTARFESHHRRWITFLVTVTDGA